jgi:Ca2+-binding RTX toxin-like protein
VARPLPALIAVAAAALAVAPAASAHSLIRVVASDALYLSQDATSLNNLTVRPAGNEIEFRDPTVDGGADPGPCRPGDTSSDGNFWLIQAFCPASAVTRVRVDLADREDTATITPGVPTEVLAGSGADQITTGDVVDVVDGGEGNDRLVTGGGNDVVTGGPGVDEIDSGAGDDRVHSRDGLPDTVRCGDGADRVEADDLDNVALDCETIARMLTAPPPDAGATSTDKTPPVVDAGAATVQRLGRRGIVRVAATSSERGTVGASGFIEIDDLRLPLTSASARIAVAGGGAELAIKLTKKQLRDSRRVLRRRKKVTVRLSVVATDAAGNSADKRAPRIRLKA